MSDISKVRPVGPWVLVKVDEPYRITEGGLYLPEGNLEERTGQATGMVIACGDGKWITKAMGVKFVPQAVKPGDRVMFRGYLKEANKPGPLDRDHSLIHMDDIHSVIEEEDDKVIAEAGGPAAGSTMG